MSSRTSVMGQATSVKSATAVNGALLQRQCACRQYTVGGECEGCKQNQMTLQRKSENGSSFDTVPPIVYEVLRSPGQPLDPATRAIFEPRFGYDFSQVRVHTDARAAESARAVNALAYTVGQNIAFGVNQYAPGTIEGRRLFAHELTHTLQQRNGQDAPLEISPADGAGEKEAEQASASLLSVGIPTPSIFASSFVGGGWLHRQLIPVPGSPVPLAGPYTGTQPFPHAPPPPAPQPCLISPDCSKPIPGSAWDFGKKVDVQQAQTAQDIAKSPEKAKAAGTARPATDVKAFAKKMDPSLLTGIYDVVVNPAIGTSAGAQAGDCTLATPKPADPNADCIEVPDELEKQAHKFNTTTDAQIGGETRLSWQTDTFQTLTHEVQHTKFEKAPPVRAGTTINTQKVANYSPDILLFELDEMNSLFSEYPIRYAGIMASSNIPTNDKTEAVRSWIVSYAIGNGEEDLRGMLKKMRCISPCSDVNSRVKKVFETQSKGWSKEQRDLFVGTVSDPKNGLDWPK